MTFGAIALPAESSGSAGSSQTSPSGTKRKLPDSDPNTSFDSVDSRSGSKAGADKVTTSSKAGRMKQKGDRFHPLFDKTDEKDRNKNGNSTAVKEGSDLVKKRRKIDLDPEDPVSRNSTNSKESSSRSRSDSNSKRKHSSSSHSHSHSHSQRQKLKSLMRPSKPTYEKEDATHLVTALKDSQDEVDRLRAELKAAKEKEDRVTVELKVAKEKEDGVRVVLDRFEEELCCGICQESFIDPVTVQPCGHSYCGKCMRDWLKSYKINEKLVWTLPGHTSNLLEVTHAQRKRAGELNLKTAVHKVNIPAPPPSVKYNQWGEAYVDDEGSDSEGSEDEDEVIEDVNGNAAAGTHGYQDDYDSEEDEDDDRSDRSGSHVSDDGSEAPPPAVNEVVAPPPIATEEAVAPTSEIAAKEAVPVEPVDAQADAAMAIDEVPPPTQPGEATPDLGEAQPAVINPEQTANPVAVVAGLEQPPGQAVPPRNIFPAHITAHAAGVAATIDAPAPPAVAPAPGPVEIKLGEGKLSSKGLSCVFCKRTPITGIVPALALGAATELLVKARPEFAREQEAIDDHRKTYEKGQALSFPIPISAVPSFVAVQKDPVRIYRDREGEGLNERYWKPCKHCPVPGRVPGRFVCPIPVPNPNRRSTRLSRDLPCPGHVLCGRCETLTPESLARVCDGCGESACKSCDMPLLKHLHEPHMYAEYLMYPEDLGNNAVHYPQFAKSLLAAFRHNATEAAIFFAWAQKQSRLASAGLAPNTSYLNRPKRFSTSHVFTELSSWLSSTEGVTANGLKGLFERFGIQGGLQKPTGGTGRFCGSCGGTIFKAGLAEWWMRHSKKTAVEAVIPTAIKDRVKCKWGNTCFYQANEAHAEQYSHLCARMTDEEIAALPEEQTAPTNTGTENNTAAFCKAHKSARLLFELDAASAPVAAPPVADTEDFTADVPVANEAVAGDVPPAPVVNPAADDPAQINENPANPGSDAASQGDDHITQDEEAAWHAAVEATLSAHDDPEDW